MYVFYQPNRSKETGDCVVRSICAATGHGWLYIFDRLVEIARQQQDMPNEFEVYSTFLERNGFVFKPCIVKKGSRRQTVATFSNRHKKGVFILKCLCHVVCVIDGNYYDSWDSGSKLVYGYWKLKKPPT